MKPTRLLYVLFSFVFLFFILGIGQPAAAQNGTAVTVVVRQLTYWQGSFVGFVDAQTYEKWPFTLDQPQQFVVTVVPATTDLTPLVLLLDASGNELARGTGTLTTSQPAGNYAVQVQPVSGSGLYVLSLRQLAPTPAPSPTPTVPPAASPTPTAAPTTAPTTAPTAVPTASPTPVPPTPIPPTPVSPAVTTSVNPASINVGDSATVTVILLNVPADGYTGAEFTCTYDGSMAEASGIAATDLFGTDPAVAIHGPQNGSFIVAIAGSGGKKATTDGTAFTFSLKGLQGGQTAVECTARVSSGNNTLAAIQSTAGSLTVGAPVTATSVPPTTAPTMTPVPTQVMPTATATPTTSSTLNGVVHASKPVTVSLFLADNSQVTSVAASSDGSFSLTAPAGTYTVVASAAGFLKAQGTVTLSDGQTSTMPTVSLLAGDIDGNNVIDQFDAMTIGMGYNTDTPAAADLNNDGVINVLDLELLARNYRASGALAWK